MYIIFIRWDVSLVKAVARSMKFASWAVATSRLRIPMATQTNDWWPSLVPLKAIRWHCTCCTLDWKAKRVDSDCTSSSSSFYQVVRIHYTITPAHTHFYFYFYHQLVQFPGFICLSFFSSYHEQAFDYTPTFYSIDSCLCLSTRTRNSKYIQIPVDRTWWKS